MALRDSLSERPAVGQALELRDLPAPQDIHLIPRRQHRLHRVALLAPGLAGAKPLLQGGIEEHEAQRARPAICKATRRVLSWLALPHCYKYQIVGIIAIKIRYEWPCFILTTFFLLLVLLLLSLCKLCNILYIICLKYLLRPKAPTRCHDVSSSSPRRGRRTTRSAPLLASLGPDPWRPPRIARPLAAPHRCVAPLSAR